MHFNYEPQLKTALNKAKEAMDAASFKSLSEFSEAPNLINGKALTDNRKYKRLLTMSQFYNNIAKPFSQVTEKDAEAFMRGIKNDHSRESTSAVIKSFYRWLDEQKYLPIIKSKALKVQSAYSKPGNVLRSQDLLTEAECMALVQAAKNPRDKALFAILIGAGFRIGEAAGITRQDIKFCNDQSIICSVNGKTGLREVKIHGGLAKFVRTWFEAMPVKKPDTLLFITQKGNPCSYSVLKKMLDTTKALADITKPLTFHKLRHRHATWALINMGSEQLVYKRLGWVPNSDMRRVYSHVDDERANQEYESALGLSPTKKVVEFQEKTCAMCGTNYSPDKELCDKCGIPLGQIVITPEDAKLFSDLLSWFKKNVLQKKGVRQ